MNKFWDWLAKAADLVAVVPVVVGLALLTFMAALTREGNAALLLLILALVAALYVRR